MNDKKQDQALIYCFHITVSDFSISDEISELTKFVQFPDILADILALFWLIISVFD